VQLTGVPSRWRIGSTSVTRVSGNWLVQDSIVTIGKRALWADAVGTYNGLPEVTTYVGGGNCNKLYQFPDHPQWRRINGYKVETATTPHDPSVTSLCAPHANGLLVFESLQRRPHGPRVSLTTLFRGMRVLGAKPSEWTTRPILVVSSGVGFLFAAAIAVLAFVVIVLAVTVALRRRAASLVRS
jgi:hypothetical protein